MDFTNLQATCSSEAMTLPKGSQFRVVAGCRVVNQPVEQAAISIPRKDGFRMLLGGAAASCTPDMIQEYWKTPLHESAKEFSPWVTTGGLYLPLPRPIGVSTQLNISRRQ